jgi:hypothetical protein
MGWAARANQAKRGAGVTVEAYPRTRSGPRFYLLRTIDAFGPIYRWADNHLVRAIPKVRGKSARRADKRQRRVERALRRAA